MIEKGDLKTSRQAKTGKKTLKLAWLWDALIVLILLLAAYFRFTGINWDENYHLHPDERFLTMVESAISPVENFKEYFDTSSSSLNPNNRGYSFYVYGTFPIFLVRYVGEYLGQTGYDQIHLVGRVVSGVFDLGAIFLVFLIGKKLYRNSKLGLLAALFAAFSVLQIQLAHFFTVDNVANFFVYASIYVTVLLMMKERKSPTAHDRATATPSFWKDIFLKDGNLALYAAFGIFYGLALASKVSVFALAGLLPLASFVNYSRLPKENRAAEVHLVLRNLILAGILAFFTFRVFQPYAFLGPGFFGLSINQDWIASLKELSVISSGIVDVPYALQWARRPLTFALQNLVQWGLGIPLGALGLLSFIWMGWRLFRGDWQKHILLWGWAAFVLVTQSINWVRSMRYLLPAYPALCLIAAWAVFKLWEYGSGAGRKLSRFNFNWRRSLAVFVAIITVVASALWATSFSGIYNRPVTRVEASRWIYENVSSAIRLTIDREDGGSVAQLLPYQNTAIISSEDPYRYGFTAQSDGELQSITLEHVVILPQSENGSLDPEALNTLLVTVDESGGTKAVQNVGAGFVQASFLPVSDGRGDSREIVLNQSVKLHEGKKYELSITVIEPDVLLKLDGGAWMTMENGGRQYLAPPAYRLDLNTPYQVSFFPQASGFISEVTLNKVVDLMNLGESTLLEASLSLPSLGEETLAKGVIRKVFTADSDPRGEEVSIALDKPVYVNADNLVQLNLRLVSGSGELAIYNDTPVIESTWDDALPLPTNGYNLFGYESGLWGNVRNLELYFDDTMAKRDTLYSSLDQSDYIFISSNRQWGSIVRVPERYPLTTEYYRALIGCPPDEDLLRCYQTAEPGMFEEELGFRLSAVFQSPPNLAGFEINDQAAEEAFTVYDHPKVLIFEKTADYDPEKMRSILDKVDLSSAVHLTPGQASKFIGNLRLDAKNLARQQSGGTWSELFPPDSVLNTHPWVAALVWYLVIMLLGVIVYPLVRIVFHGLPDRGYPFSRLVGLVLAAYFVWLAASTLFDFSRVTILVVLILLVLANAFLAYKQRRELYEEVKRNRRYFLNVELLMLLLFLIFLGIRYANPDLWHPWRGGEKPMDLSYFTAVVKSTVFPPYDPWYAGGYINYYYYGFVLVGVPVKLLGIEPAIAYNLILPTLFALTGLGAFSIGWNLFARRFIVNQDSAEGMKSNHGRSLMAGLISAAVVLVLGNLGTLRMITQGIQKLAAPGAVIEGAGVIEKFSWFFQGLVSFFKGSRLIFGIGEWYWVPSRAIPGDVITEFPFFTFTYADLHAHLIALPVTLLVIGWGLGILRGKWQWQKESGLAVWVMPLLTFLVGGLTIGMLRATNTWDFPTYLLLSCIIVLYTVLRYGKTPDTFFPALPSWMRTWLYVLLPLVLLIGSALLYFLPFTENFYQAYGSITLWTGGHSPLGSFLVHWGLQLFVLVSWFVWETREWLAATPLSSLLRFRPYFVFIQVLIVLFILVLVLITLLGIEIGWLAGILEVWAAILIFRPKQPDIKRLVLFMTGTALVLTFFVEGFVLAGDIGRMNTVFKFYYQAWTLLGLSAAAALIWLLPAVFTRWRAAASTIWQTVLILLVFGAAMYPFTATIDKARDRMSDLTPKTLDGLDFMATSQYFDQTGFIELNQDYEGILWMQQNVSGSPVIVEANTVEYRWGNRYTIYTGLPGVLGWNWHQRQQRGGLDYEGIATRLTDIAEFYTTQEINTALTFLKKYNVSYIILGQMERAYYQGDCLDKFTEFEGVYWKEVFREMDTVIYQVITE